MKKNEQFKPSKSAQSEFTRALKKVARASGHLVETHIDGVKIKNEKQMTKALEAYSEALGPWAVRQSEKMLEQVMKSNRKAYTNQSKAIGLALRLNVAENNVDKAAAALMLEQVGLIKSIPIEAGKRAQELALEAIYNGTRSDEIAQELLNTTSVTESRAKLIARTETARANAVITQSRAVSVGSQGYIWRTSMDGAERKSHAEMNGKYVSYDKPPRLTDGTTGHAGSFPNCFPGDTKVDLSNGCIAIMRHFYEGDIVEVNGVGVHFSATPNHPVLTDRGWVACGDLNEGDNLFHIIQDRSAAREYDKDNHHLTFQELWESFTGPLVQGTHLIKFNFHNYVPDQKVDVISTYDYLSLKRNPECLKSIRELLLSETDRRIQFVFVSMDSKIVSSYTPCRGDQIRFIQRGEFTESSKVGITPVSGFYTVLDENSFDDIPTHGELFRNGESTQSGIIFRNDIFFRKMINPVISRFPGLINASHAETIGKSSVTDSNFLGDRVESSSSFQVKSTSFLNKTFRKFSGHVYTLQTETGWFTVEDSHVITRNCRCYQDVQYDEE